MVNIPPISTYKNGEDWGMFYDCFTHITQKNDPFEGKCFHSTKPALFIRRCFWSTFPMLTPIFSLGCSSSSIDIHYTIWYCHSSVINQYHQYLKKSMHCYQCKSYYCCYYHYYYYNYYYCCYHITKFHEIPASPSPVRFLASSTSLWRLVFPMV